MDAKHKKKGKTKKNIIENYQVKMTDKNRRKNGDIDQPENKR